MRPIRSIAAAAATILCVLFATSCATGSYASGGTRTYLGFSIGIQSAPPPPRIVYDRAPRYVAVEESDVEVVEAPNPDCDMFQYQDSFYLYSDGFWYRSSSYNGPFRVIEVRRVPRAVLIVPENHWHHRPHWDRGDRDDHKDRGKHRGWGHDHD